MQRITGLPDEQVAAFEVQIEAAMRAALADVMDKIARRVEASVPALVGAVGDEPPGQPYVSPDDLASIPPLWQQAVADQILPIAAQVFLSAALQTHANMIDASSIAGLPSVGSLAAERYLAQARNTFEQVGDHLWETARAQLGEGFEAGESIPQLAERLRASASVTARTGVLVARTQVIEASNAGSFETAQASGLQMKKEWIATPDLRTRPTHLAADGQRVDLNEPFIVGGYSAMFPAAPNLPPSERYSCFPAGTPVLAVGVRRVYRHWYEGDLVEVVDGEGFKLAGTPNHPVLTQRGWVGLGDLLKSDKLVNYVDDVHGASDGHDVHAVPAKIEELFNAATATGLLVRVARLAVNFHGDRPQGDVDVVAIDGQLRDGMKSAADDLIEDFLLPASDEGPRVLATDRGLGQGLGAAGAAADSVVGSLGESRSLFGRGLGHAGEHGGATPPSLDSSPTQEVGEGGSLDAGFDGKRLLGFSGQVALNKIVAIQRIPWSGHVYNLETSTGAYVAGYTNTVVRNCRCTIGYVMPDKAPKQLRADDLQAQELADLPGTNPIDDLAAAQTARLQAIIDAQHARVEQVIEDVHRRFGETFPKAAEPGPIDLPARGTNPPGYVRPSLRDAKTPRQLRRVWQDEAESFTGFPFVVDAMPRGISMVTAREYAEGTLQMLEQFPGARVDRVHWFDDAASSSYAQVRRGGNALEFNMRYASETGRSKFLAARRKDAAGWDNGGATSWGVRNDLGGQGVVYHEFTHILDIENGREVIHGQIVPLLIRHAQAEGITDIDDLIKRRISSYATKNYQEMVAEAGTDVMINGAAASQLSRDIFDLLRVDYRRRGFALRSAPIDDLAAEAELFPKVASPQSMTVADLRAELTARGIAIPPKARKADLVREVTDARAKPGVTPVAPVAPRALSTQTVAQLRALAKERGIAVPPGARKADLVKALEEGPKTLSTSSPAIPSLEVRTSLTAAEQARVRTLVGRDSQIYATIQDRLGSISTSGNLSDIDAAWLQEIFKRDRVFIERAAQEARIRERLDAAAERLGVTPAEYRAREAARLKALLDDKPIIIRRGERGLQDILASGRFKTSLETGKRQPGLAVDKDRRKLGESVMGIADDVSLAERPVYGYVGIRGAEPALSYGRKIAGIAQREGQEDALSAYGQIEVVLKPEVRARTTVTVGDSLDEMAFIRPSSISNPTAESFSGKLDWLDDPGWTRRSYVEAQIHGGVRREDILEIIFPDDPTVAMVSALREFGIPWRVLRKGDAPIFPAAVAPTAPVLDEKALLRVAARERNRLIESSQGTAKLLAEVDELIANKATKAAIRQRLDPALIAPEQIFAGADADVVAALRTALDTGDTAKLRAALTRATTKAKLKPVSKAGAKTTFDADTMEGVGGIDIPTGAQVTVVRRGTTLTLPDGTTMQLTRAQVTPIAPARVEPLPATSTSKTVAKGDFSGLTRVSEPLGGNPGGIFEASDGSRWYVKAAVGSEQARSEALALDLYRAAGLDAPEMVIGRGAGGLGDLQVATRMIDDAKVDLRARIAAGDEAYLDQVREGFSADAWLANWDVVGANPAAGRGWDNIVSVAGQPVRIEAGGALRFRGLGGDKKFTADVAEFDTLRDPATAKRAAEVFGDMTPEQIIASAERVRKVTPARIKALVKKHDLDPELADTLIARRADILARAAELAPKPPMTVREYNAAIKAAAKGQDALDAVPYSTTDRSFGPLYEPDAVDRYRLGPDVNDVLRGARRGGPQYADDVRDIDRFFDESRLVQDAELWRAPGSGRGIFGDQTTWGDDLAGFEWSDPAYSSTSASRSVADRFTKDGGVRLRILAPKGSKTLQLSETPHGGTSGYADEAEVLLGRGARYRVVKDRGWTEITHPTQHTKIRVRDLDVEVIVPDVTPPLPWATN